MTAATKIQTHRYAVEVVDQGSREPAAVFLHGWEGPLAGAEFLQKLAAGRRTVAPVHPGFAESAKDHAINDVHNVVVFYQELLDCLGLGQVDLIGHSLGGMFAAEVAAASPGRIRKLVLVDPLGLWDDARQLPDFMSLGGRRLNSLLWADADAATSFAPPLSEDPVEANVLRTANLAAAANYLWPIPDRGLRARLYRIQCPTLLVWGESDGAVPPSYAEDFAKEIPDARIALITGAAHYPMIEQPARFLGEVLPFLEG